MSNVNCSKYIGGLIIEIDFKYITNILCSSCD